MRLLQWSHVFSDMVSKIWLQVSGNSEKASMEPCLFRHGKLELCLMDSKLIDSLQWSHVFSDMVRRTAAQTPSLPGTRFNGAMSFQTW